MIVPPRLAASEKVTKSFLAAPLLVSVTVTVEDPFDAENVTSPAEVVTLNGVMSLGLTPSTT